MPFNSADTQPLLRQRPVVQPRGLRRTEAAAYLGISPTSFDEGVRDGSFPKPKRFRGCVIWDIRQLDLAFDALPGGGDSNPWHEALAS